MIRTNRRLTPFMETALRALCRGPLEWTLTGWTSSLGIAGTWNTHTVKYLARQRWCVVRGKRASITADGIGLLGDMDGLAA